MSAILLTLVLAGCAELPGMTPLVSQPVMLRNENAMESDITAAVYRAADAIIQGMRDPFNPRSPIIPATFVNTDDLDETSPLGRLLARQMGSRFTQRGFSVSEVKLRKNLFIRKDDGEFMMTRELKELQAGQKAQAVILGSYTIAKSRIFVSTQLVRLSDRVAVGAADFDLPMSNNVRSMLGMLPEQLLEKEKSGAKSK
ncbi:MAG: hypothetical protein HQL51_12985 [Magnetococcales bacterium]|nr:hypothetical protein [Magnetococcales bacterium]